MTLTPVRRFLQRHKVLKVRTVVSAPYGDGAQVTDLFLHYLGKHLGDRVTFDITETSSAQAILAAARGETIDLAILALTPPPTQWACWGRRPGTTSRPCSGVFYLKQLYGIPVIAIAIEPPSGPELAQQAWAAGADYFFYPPVSSRDLAEAVQECLERDAWGRGRAIRMSIPTHRWNNDRECVVPQGRPMAVNQ